MCLPIIAIAGGLMSAAGSVMAGNAQAAAYESQAKMDEHNAKLAELAGKQELQKGAREEKRLRSEAAQFASSQRTAFAASGVQMSGSPLNILADTAMGIEEDAAALRFGTLQNKYGYDVNAVNYRNAANAARSNAKNSKQAGWMGGFSTLLNTGGNVLGMSPQYSTGSKVKGSGITLGRPDKDGKNDKKYGYGGYLF